ncbi:histidine--tRNA ligase [Desulfuribacillus stibiiarsenatis]|uniref:Histidine--tRNA ligase n=1 Tax=Desulfuribacillus stibiiarsenatis TaxID=1390249 RepID=A0A1E5L3L5_9FIRM|nr:histidine--tRNA ligase [Desulfuribacillus stibiiarsenatis]
MNAPRGTYDVLPTETSKWQYIEGKIRDWCNRYQFQEIRTPIFEYTQLFQRGVGDTTDIVQKEMYTFTIHEDSLTLRPEGTASTVRAVIKHKLYAQPQPLKLYYMGPMFRYERPQAGRNRQFTQFGLEVLGTEHPSIDAEVIVFAYQLFSDLGLKNLKLDINSVGCPKCRKDHKEKMMQSLSLIRQDLCKDCDTRFEKNPLRILDCKNETCKELTKDAPMLINHLCEDCNDHYSKVKTYLQALQIPFNENPRLVRGLDYYTQTAFEIMEDSIGAMSTICGGGRYNGLVEQLGGPATPGIGFAIGLERLLLAMEAQKVEIPTMNHTDVYAVSLGQDADVICSQWVFELRNKGLSIEKDYLSRSMKAQLKAADRLKAKHVIIVGETELETRVAIIRNMETSEQQSIPFEKVVDYILGGIQ